MAVLQCNGSGNIFFIVVFAFLDMPNNHFFLGTARCIFGHDNLLFALAFSALMGILCSSNWQ